MEQTEKREGGQKNSNLRDVIYSQFSIHSLSSLRLGFQMSRLSQVMRLFRACVFGVHVFKEFFFF